MIWIYNFSKDASELALIESSLLVGLLPAPAIYSPVKYPERAERRKNLVIKVMNDLKFISDAQYQEAKNE